MVFWAFLLINIATFLLTELLRPKPNIEDAKPAGLGDFNVPTATEGRAVPLIYGRVKMAGPNVVWYGDLIADPITEKIKTGLFSSETVTQGFRYSIGLQMALCRGPVDLLVNIRNDQSFAWGPDAPSADTPIVPVDAGTAYFIDEPSFFGGDEAGGGGGLIGGGRIFPGTETQAISLYLEPFQSPPPTPAYRGTCYVTWERGEIGLGPQLRAFEFELDRFPDGLDLATLQPGDEEVDLGVNPMNVVYEVLTNTEWGLAQGAGKIDLTNFRAQAAILKTEGHGFAWIWDRVQDVLELIKLIEQQVDGVLTEDPVSGQFRFTLVRFDYTPGTLPLLDETNVRRVTRFQRPAWAETQNQIAVEFTDRRKNYTTSFALAQDMGNQDIVKAVNAAKVRYPGVKNPTLANAIAWREIRALSTPVATMKIVTDRSQYAVVPGDVLEFSWARFGITRLPIRVTRVDRGRILENEITIDVAQDIFAFNAGSFADPIDTGWLPVATDAQPSLRERLWEVPFQLSLDNERHLGVICSRDGGLHISFEVQSDRIDSPNFNLEGTEADFTPTAVITAAISRDKGDVTPFVQDIEVDGLNDITISQLIAAASTTIDPNDPANVFLIDEELFFYETVLDLGSGLVRLETCHAGLFDTVPADHIDNSVVWLIGHGLGLMQRNGALPSPPGAIDVKILPTTIRNTLDIISAATLSTTVGQRILNPIPPGDPFLNGNRFHDLDGWTRAVGTLDFTWNTRNRETQGFDTKQDDADIQQSGDVGAHIIVRRVDTSVAVVDFDNIFSDQFITTNFLPQSSPGIPDELDFTAEITNKTTAGNEGQVAITRAFEVFGFGIDFGGDFGGEAPNNGIVLDAGAPPFTPEPIPGSGLDRAWTIDFLGTVNAGEDRRYLLNFTDTLNQDTVLGFNFFIPASSFPTLEDMAEEFRRQAQVAVDFPPEPMPFQITRIGTQVLITTRFGDFSLRMQPGAALVADMTPGALGLVQAAAPAQAPIRQIIFMDWFKSGVDPVTGGIDVLNDVLSPTNSPCFATGATAVGNVNRVFILASTWEQFQNFGGNNSALFSIGGFDDGVDTSRTQQIPDFYDDILASEAIEFMEVVEGPLALRGGLDNPMLRTGIVIELKDNYSIREQTVAFAVDASGPATSCGGFRFIPKVGRQGRPGLATGLTHVTVTGMFNNINATDGATLSMTLDGTIFSEVISNPPPVGFGSSLLVAWEALLDDVDLDARFRVLNRRGTVADISQGAQIASTSFNTPFEAYQDFGFGLRIEFRDISP